MTIRPNSRPIFLRIVVCLTAFASAGSILNASATTPFMDRLGLQLYSLRVQALKNMPAALDHAKAFGISNLEIAGTGSLSVEAFDREVRKRGLTVVGDHVRYVLLQKDVKAAIAASKAVGAKYIMTSLPPPRLAQIKDEKDAQEVVREFTAWGEACRAEGIQFGYHTHGGEFVPLNRAGDTLLDILVRDTRPDLMCLQMDVFWVFIAGQDPVKLLRKYSSRWKLMHLKDLQKGIPLGGEIIAAGHKYSVAIGTGQIDWPAVLSAAEKIGIEHYFIEEESSAPLENIPPSIEYLKKLSTRL